MPNNTNERKGKQAGDTGCSPLTINHTGAKGPSASCW